MHSLRTERSCPRGSGAPAFHRNAKMAPEHGLQSVKVEVSERLLECYRRTQDTVALQTKT